MVVLLDSGVGERGGRWGRGGGGGGGRIDRAPS